MARLFGKEYHENSNSWFFKSSLLTLNESDLVYKKFLDENSNVVLEFEPAESIKEIFPVKIDILYDPGAAKIIKHNCSKCGTESCKHFFSIINFAYHNVTTDHLSKNAIQTYQANLLSYNEYWQRVVLNGRIELEDIFDNNTDKIRISLKSYKPMDIRLVSILITGRTPHEEDIPFVKQAHKQVSALSSNEFELLRLLQIHKCSYSRKNFFFTIYKKDFVKFIPILKNLQKKTYIKETGDKINFPQEEFSINFIVNKNSDGSFIFTPTSRELLSAIFVGRTSYFFIQNRVFELELPFNKDISEEIFSTGLTLKKEDLVYFSSIVTRQLGLIKCYLDFAENIKIPEIHNNTPVISFDLYKENEKIHMTGHLAYSEGLLIPMSVIRFPAELIRYDQDEEENWFYVPPQIKYQIFDFVQKLPAAETDFLDESSVLVFAGEENIENLKKTIFEYSDPAWNISLSEELKSEFIYKVKLKPLIRTRKATDIKWFEYEVEYKFKDISFSHEDLKKFFKTKEKFLKLDDGRLLYFENKYSFFEVDKILQKGKKTVSGAYRLAIYNLPYIYQLSSINTGIKVAGDQFLDTMFSSILNRKLKKYTELPDFLKPVMRSYQKTGFNWLVMLQHYHLGGILADDMGLGKTIQAISILSILPENSKTIVICPKTLLFNWAVEIKKFSRNLSFRIYEGNQQDRKDILDNFNFNVLLASYSIIQNDIEELAEINFDYIILDEAQHIKNSIALRTKAIKKLKSTHKLALSGTPIENNHTELWSIFDFLMPGYLPSLRKFKTDFMTKTREANDRLKKMISPFILRRKKKDVLIELPDKQVQIAYCKLTPIQEKIYLQVLQNVRQDMKNREGDGNFLHILAALTKLRQVCDHPALLNKEIKDLFDISGKIELLQEIIIDAIESGRKLLIFSQFVRMLQIMKKLMIKLQIPFEYMDGQTKQRQKSIDNFNNNNNIKVFLVSLKTGGFGLNLTAADTVILIDPWWNPMGEEQAIDRVHRIGQTKKVLVYKIITKGTIEEKIITLQQNKREIFENIIEDGQSFFKFLNVEQLRDLLEY